ncbi:MAG: RlpA-like double-psi beta-barrel-protein domain-containing protein-containing protein, partial [Piptocephalis tieghemiana]
SRKGEATFFEPNDGSCGGKYGDMKTGLVALSDKLMKGKSPNTEYCGRTIQITRGGKVATAVVADTCPECPEGNIDLDLQTFEKLGTEDEGRIPVTWCFV